MGKRDILDVPVGIGGRGQAILRGNQEICKKYVIFRQNALNCN